MFLAQLRYILHGILYRKGMLCRIAIYQKVYPLKPA